MLTYSTATSLQLQRRIDDVFCIGTEAEVERLDESVAHEDDVAGHETRKLRVLAVVQVKHLHQKHK